MSSSDDGFSLAGLERSALSRQTNDAHGQAQEEL